MPWILLSDDYSRVFINDDAPIQLETGQIVKFNCCDIVRHDEFKVYVNNKWCTANISTPPLTTVVEVLFESWMVPVDALNLVRNAMSNLHHEDIHTLSVKLKV